YNQPHGTICITNEVKETMMLREYHPEPFTDFSVAANQAAFAAALEQVKAEVGRTYPLVIGGQHLLLDDVFASVNPSRPDEVIGYCPQADAGHVDQAVAAAQEAFQTWQYTPADERSRYLLRAAAELRRRKHECSACMVLEVGKSWMEADADTA